MDIESYWKAVLLQDAEAMRPYFAPEAQVNWHNTNECFTVSEFIRANCEYPGQWEGEIERIECVDDLMITVVHVVSSDRTLSLHVTSFIKVANGKIVSIDEYWGDDGAAPQWRLDMQLGRPIHK